MSQCCRDTVGSLFLFSHSTSLNHANTQLEAVGFLEMFISMQATAALLVVLFEANF